MRRNRWPDVIGIGGRMLRNTHQSVDLPDQRVIVENKRHRIPRDHHQMWHNDQGQIKDARSAKRHQDRRTRSARQFAGFSVRHNLLMAKPRLRFLNGVHEWPEQCRVTHLEVAFTRLRPVPRHQCQMAPASAVAGSAGPRSAADACAPLRQMRANLPACPEQVLPDRWQPISFLRRLEKFVLSRTSCRCLLPGGKDAARVIRQEERAMMQ